MPEPARHASRNPVTVTVITLDAREDLERCLASVEWADEIVVVDAGSTDGTQELARTLGARVVRRPWPGYVAQKNHALECATHDWVLSLDADEWLDAAAAREIEATLAAPRADGYEIDRRSSFCGVFLRGGWSPDWQLRLFRKSCGRFAGGRVHESVRMSDGARVARLTARLSHRPYRSLSDYVQRMDRYTSLAAETLRERGRRPTLRRLLLNPPAAFFKTYVIKRGYRDGVRGLLVAAGSAFYVLLKYGKLWELKHARPPQKESADEEAPRRASQ